VEQQTMHEIRQANPLHLPDSDELRYLPEGPIPLGESLVSWIGIQHGHDQKTGSLNLFDLAKGVNESFDLPGRPGFALPCQTENTFVIGCERSLVKFNTFTRDWAPFCDGIDGDVENTIINDGVVFKDNLIFGTKDLEFANKKAGLYLYRGVDKKLIRLRDDQICSNGKAILNSESDSPSLLDIDSPTRKVVRYSIDIEAGQLGPAETVLDFAGDPAVPDGAILTPDQSGIIVSFFLSEVADYGETRLYELATGNLLSVWQTEASPQNTCPVLVRHQRTLKLLIATATENMSEADRQACPNAGKFFLAESGLANQGQFLTSRFPLE
jgi:sugar lactone lactonase YvrE